MPNEIEKLNRLESRVSKANFRRIARIELPYLNWKYIGVILGGIAIAIKEAWDFYQENK